MDTRRRYARIARAYDILDLPFERGRYQPLRRQLFTELRGARRVLDAGVGTGRNMPFYPADAEVTGIDISRPMLERARRRRAELGADVELIEMDVCRTAFADDSFDAVVATFLFCVLDEAAQEPALRELARVCRPGGTIRLLDYTYSAQPLRRLEMKIWAPWVRFAYGASFDRDTERHARRAGLEAVSSRFLVGDIIRLLVLAPGKGA